MNALAQAIGFGLVGDTTTVETISGTTIQSIVNKESEPSRNPRARPARPAAPGGPVPRGSVAFGRSVVDFNADSVTATNTGHAMAAIDIASFTGVAAFKAQVDAVCDEIKNSAPLPGAEPIRIPGESSAAVQAHNLCAGIPVGEDLPGELNQLAADCGCRPIDQD